ncbi:MAG TPA: MBL fold metallo-hydrolase [Burkholderiaceae bacterium]|nr:MBL fold metallo-hydrolase [Burkholderiaceae bacterium]
MLRVCSLGSGSSGNGLVVEAREGVSMTRILIDDGFNLRQLERRLQRAGLAPDSLDAVFVTHEHSDHVGGVAALARRYSIDIYCTEGTAAAGGLVEQRIPWRSIQAGDVLEVGLLGISPFAVPHDAQEPVQYVFTDGSRRAGLLTDVGECSDSIIDALSGLHALILECNHDADLLRNGSYPAFLKQRIAGPHGHLSNAQAAGILDRARSATLAWVAAAHLSRSNNRPELAQQALAQVLGCVAREISVLDQEEGLPWREV